MKFSDFRKKFASPPVVEPKNAEQERQPTSPTAPEPQEEAPPPPPADIPEERNLPTNILFSRRLTRPPQRYGDRPAASRDPAPPPPPAPAGRPPAAAPRPARLPAGDARKVYGDAIRVMRAVLDRAGRRPPPAQGELRGAAEAIARAMAAGDQALLALTMKSSAGNYLYGHSVNVAVLSAHLGAGLGWSEGDLLILALSALLHDLGLAGRLDTLRQPRALTEREREELRTHPIDCGGLLDHIHDIEETERRVIADIVGQGQERITGKGPQGLRRVEDIAQGAQIIGICDVYEALSHHRNWREPLIPHEALKAIIRQSAPEFDQRLVKYLLERLSLYPPGSYVLLSTEEVGLVVGIHPGFPTRPIVEVKTRPDKTADERRTLLDLAEMPVVHVVRAIDETKLNVKDKKLLLQMQAARWWSE